MAKETIATGMTQYENKGAHPTGKVCTDTSDASTVSLPKRTTGAGTLPEVIFDENTSVKSDGKHKR